MNVVYLSPQLPSNYYPFCRQLKIRGVKVLGISQESYDLMRYDVKESLTEYFRVSNLEIYDEVRRAVGYFIHRYGRIDRIESHTEKWLETEARLREDFNVPGPKPKHLIRFQRKSEMKKLFKETGVLTGRSRLVRTYDQAQELVNEMGFPVVIKPDIGAGASNTHKISNLQELEDYFFLKPPADYLIEEYIRGIIHSFDGVADNDGKPVFYTSHVLSQGIMETVNTNSDLFIYSQRAILKDLEEAGMALLAQSKLTGRFFHIEFIRSTDGGLYALEINMRPPGGLSTEMFNYANDIDVYSVWADITVGRPVTLAYERPYHCCYIGRKLDKLYHHRHYDVLRTYKDIIAHHAPIQGRFRDSLGDYGYLVRSPSLELVLGAARYFQALEEEDGD
jgi:hypothetical protein